MKKTIHLNLDCWSVDQLKKYVYAHYHLPYQINDLRNKLHNQQEDLNALQKQNCYLRSECRKLISSKQKTFEVVKDFKRIASNALDKKFNLECELQDLYDNLTSVQQELDETQQKERASAEIIKDIIENVNNIPQKEHSSNEPEVSTSDSEDILSSFQERCIILENKNSELSNQILELENNKGGVKTICKNNYLIYLLIIVLTVFSTLMIQFMYNKMYKKYPKKLLKKKELKLTK
ncbi:hypothetical protein AB837_00400 [bacterium AB1]|nr:hypothetical protein AB837_00400 [bacterium AB1]